MSTLVADGVNESWPWCGAPGVLSGAQQIVAIDLASGRRTPLTRARPRSTQEWDFWQRWAPDGERLVFASRRDGPWRLWVVGARGGGEAPLETRPDPDGTSPKTRGPVPR